MSLLLRTSFIPTSPHTLRCRRLGPSARPRGQPIKAKIREIFMPALSSTMTEGKIVSWVKSEGDKLAKGEAVVVVESDKADMDVESFYDGYLAAIIVDEGSSAPVGSPIALLAESQEEIALALERRASLDAGGGAAENHVKEEETAVVVAVKKPGREEGKVVLGVGTHPASEGGRRVVASPYAKKLATEFGVDLRGVVGTGPSGRVVAKDVEAAASAVAVGEKVSVNTGAQTVELGTTVPFTTMQSAVSRNMLESLGVPTFRVGYTITTDALDALYKKVYLLELK